MFVSKKSTKMSQRPITAKIDTGLSKSVSARQTSNLSRKSSHTVTNVPTSSRLPVPQRPKSASHCCGATDSPSKRPWSNSVLIENKPSTGSCGKNDAKPSPNRKLGYIPPYIRKRRSSTSVDKVKVEDRLEDETPPPLVPSENGQQNPERRLLRQRTFDQKERQQLEEALKELTEEKKMLEAQNQWLKEESESRQQIIGTENQRNKQLEAMIREMSEAMTRLQCEQLASKETVEELSPTRNELMEQIDALKAENESLKKEMESLQIQSFEDIVSNKEYPVEKKLDETKMIGLLQRDLQKYRMARQKLKEIIQSLVVENQQLRDSIANHRNEGSTEWGQRVGHGSGDEEVVDRTDFFENFRKHKREQQKLIEVKKYNS